MNNLEPNKWIEQLIRPQILGPLLIIIGFIGLYFSTIVRNPYTILYPLVLIGAVSAFYLLRPHTEIKMVILETTYLKAILVVIFVLCSLLILQYRASGFHRTNIVFYFTFAAYVFSALFILSSSHETIGLLTILLIGITNRLTSYYNSALYSGVDIYSHSHFVQTTAQEGSLIVFSTNKYFYSPFYHILVAVGELTYSVPTRDAIALTVLLAVTVLPVIIVYSITSAFWNRQVGLIAGWLYVTADFAINWGIQVIPTSLGVVFFALLLFSLVKYTNLKEKRQYGLVISFIVSLMFTHQVSLFIGITAIGVLTLVILIYRMELSETALNLGLVAGFSMFVDFIVTKYSGPSGEASFFDVVLGNLLAALLSMGALTRSEIKLPQDPTISPSGAAALTLLQVTGSALLLLLAVFGALYWLSMQRTNREFFTGVLLSGIVTALLAVTLAGPAIGLRNLLPNRWWAFLYLPLTILAGPGLLVLVQEMRYKWTGRSEMVIGFVVLLLFISPYTVLMVGNHAGAPDQPFLDDAPGAESLSISDQDQELIEHSERYQGDLDIITDRRLSAIFSRYYDVSSRTLYIDYNEPASLYQPSIIVNRKYIHTKHAQYEVEYNDQRMVVHGAFPLKHLPVDNKSQLYNSGDNSLTYYRV
ncbi:hypothetical protein [Natronomonas salsuginis]|uniref:Glycosyltransferase RgtA/B/C/D-like domain-containing protein n=1 Tax=Natronomonas salsuginis TaxID=2217661 RepID=A0A4U5J8Q8_9EURY|nr:hypothetical protein [Natronomonas salsuginis]TKR25462.1 hypothetical protein DM868_08535 [Natronomonas salsuginis]